MQACIHSFAGLVELWFWFWYEFWTGLKCTELASIEFCVFWVTLSPWNLRLLGCSSAGRQTPRCARPCTKRHKHGRNAFPLKLKPSLSGQALVVESCVFKVEKSVQWPCGSDRAPHGLLRYNFDGLPQCVRQNRAGLWITSSPSPSPPPLHSPLPSVFMYFAYTYCKKEL